MGYLAGLVVFFLLWGYGPFIISAFWPGFLGHGVFFQLVAVLTNIAVIPGIIAMLVTILVEVKLATYHDRRRRERQIRETRQAMERPDDDEAGSSN